MILGFKTQINGKPTFFPQKILACVSEVYAADFQPKLHTIREGNRWKAGDTLHMATGVRTKDYLQFNKEIRELEKVQAVQSFEIEWYGSEWAVFIDDKVFYRSYWEQDKDTDEQMEQLALNDGFDSVEDFISWFNEDMTGQIIHWTPLKYCKDENFGRIVQQQTEPLKQLKEFIDSTDK